jgi:hypothetical protein
MKKCFFILAITAFGYQPIFGQASFVITDAGSINVTNTTQTYGINKDIQDTRIYDVLNTSPNTINVKVRRTIIQLCNPNAVTSFCTGQNCYAPATNMSIQFSVGPGSSFTITADYFPDSIAGIGHVRYAVLDQAVAADSVVLDIIYNKGPTGINSSAVTQPSISDPYPNPAASSFCMSVFSGQSNTPVAMNIYSACGSLVMEKQVSGDNNTIDISELENGIYFISIETEGKIISTKRLVVAH